MRDIEINFCTDDDVTTVTTVAVPRVGEVVSIRGADFTVTRVFWAIDCIDHVQRGRRLRATVEIKPIRLRNPDGEIVAVQEG